MNKKDDVGSIFAKLKKILSQHESKLVNVTDTDDNYYMDTAFIMLKVQILRKRYPTSRRVSMQVLKVFIPNKFTSSRVLHRTIYWGLKYFVSPEANFLILRHFHIGSEILAFIADNVPGITTDLHRLKPNCLRDLLDDYFLKHDLNLFNFVIQLNLQLRDQGYDIESPAQINFDSVTDEPFPLDALPMRFTNVIDVQTAIELYTPLYQLFLTDNDFWRASNSLQLDETVGLYVSRILNNSSYLGLLNNKHPMVPLSTITAGFRLMLHGLAAETLHATLREQKNKHVVTV